MEDQYIAKVVNGHLTLSVPTDLPEGEEVVLVALDEDTLPEGSEDLDALMEQARAMATSDG